MKKFIKERNDRIRADYKRIADQYRFSGDKKYSDRAIDDLVKIYSAWELSYETIRLIVFNSNYGAVQKYGIKLKGDGGDWMELRGEDGNILEFSSKPAAIAMVKKLKSRGKIENSKIKAKPYKIPPDKPKKAIDLAEDPAQLTPSQQN